MLLSPPEDLMPCQEVGEDKYTAMGGTTVAHTQVNKENQSINAEQEPELTCAALFQAA